MYEYDTDETTSPLRHFVGLPDDSLLVLGARRSPPVISPIANTNTSISISTSVGFSQLSVSSYVQATSILRPDIVVGLGDVPYGAEKVSRKKTDKVNDRTLAWMKQQLEASTQRQSEGSAHTKPCLFAPILPLPIDSQRWYLDNLMKDLKHNADGLAIYDSSSLADLPPELHRLPKLCLTTPRTPHHLLREISLGADILTIPFISEATDAGIALDFSFPPPPPTTPPSPISLGIDMWHPTHAISLSRLSSGCECYTCATHHRAYIQHLLSAKEMLGWVLLQIHNHAILDRFFAGVRDSLAAGTFELDRAAFQSVYEPELPAKTGLGPRVRGYQYRSEGPGEVKRNAAAYKNFDVGVVDAGIDAPILAEKGLGEETS